MQARKSPVGLLVMLSSLVLAAGGRTPSTELTLVAMDPEGNPASAAQARLILVAWGETKEVDLEIAHNRVSVALDPAWLARTWPQRARDVSEAILYLSAEGLAPIASEPFSWLGTLGGDGQVVTSVEIVFPRHQTVRIDRGASAALDIRLRSPGERRLRLVDGHGAPVPEVMVSTFVYWSRANHCGRLSGEQLAEATSDDNGRVPVPDGDLLLAFAIVAPSYSVRDNDLGRPQGIVRRLAAEETVVELTAWKPRTLELRVMTASGRAPSGVPILACIRHCVCGACCGPLAETGADGRVVLDPFYDEEWETLEVPLDNGEPAWRADPRSLPRGAPVTVRLP